MKLDAPQFSTEQVAQAVGVDPLILKQWLYRGIALSRSSGDIPSRGPGYRRRFTLRTVLRFGVVVELVRLGFPPTQAGQVALGFADSSDDRRRRPGELYPLPELTILVVHPGGTGRVQPAAPKKANLADIFAGTRGSSESAIILNLNSIDRRVRDALKALIAETEATDGTSR